MWGLLAATIAAWLHLTGAARADGTLSDHGVGAGAGHAMIANLQTRLIRVAGG